jgi:CheY-like chemotaxis protein
MPRLLLVDDNPSIHRIAESLLAPTDVELTCVDSAAEALDRIGRGERFDVALVDTSMPGMDGWTLLDRLRSLEATAQMPIALMAGVLDPVDPSKLAKASIQGFLKKPIELRELGDRVKALLATPVAPPSPSPFSTVPATPARDLVKHAEAALPEFRAESAGTPMGFLPAEPHPAEPEADLLLLTEEDLWPEEALPALPVAAVLPPAIPDMHLELEELDLDSLQDLVDEPLLPLHPDRSVLPEPEFPFEHEDLHLEGEDHLMSLDDLEALPTDFQLPPAHPESEPTQAPDRFPEAAEPHPHLPVAASLMGAASVAAVAGLAAHATAPEAPEPVHEAHDLAHEVAWAEPVAHEPLPGKPGAMEAPAPVAGGQAPAAPGQVAPGSASPAPVSAEQARAVVQALLADPVLVDALVKAVVARMGDQVLREIAWEVMPDLAGRLQQ